MEFEESRLSITIHQRDIEEGRVRSRRHRELVIVKRENSRHMTSLQGQCRRPFLRIRFCTSILTLLSLASPLTYRTVIHALWNTCLPPATQCCSDKDLHQSSGTYSYDVQIVASLRYHQMKYSRRESVHSLSSTSWLCIERLKAGA